MVSAAPGGLLTPELASEVRCPAVAGLANDQLPDAQVADPFDERGMR